MRMVSMALLLVLCCLVYVPLNAEQLPEDALLNERLSLKAGEKRSVRIIADANNVYTFASFGSASAALYAEGEMESAIRVEGFCFDARLITGASYILELEAGSEGADVEIMRATFGRCYERPIELDIYTPNYVKLIARAYDTHWYAFTAEETGLYTVTSQSDIDMAGYLLDESGRVVAMSDDLFEPYERDFWLRAPLEAGKRYHIRVSAKNAEVGQYALSVSVNRENAVLPEAVEFSDGELTLTHGDETEIEYALRPLSDETAVRFFSTNDAVATVSSEGLVSAEGVGEAVIYAFVSPGVFDSCRVTVKPIAVEGISFASDYLTIAQQQRVPLDYTFMPKNASNQKIHFSVSDPNVAEVDAHGVVTAHGVGEAVVTATTDEGGYRSQIVINVIEPRPVYRALVLGEQQYVNRGSRIGSVKSTQGMSDMLRLLDFDGDGYSVTMRMDSTRADIIRRIRFVFADAKPNDVSLFYINCHGDYVDGVAYLELHDGSRLSAEQLEMELRKIPGTVIVIIDCCQSGSFLSGDAAVFNDAVIQAFGRGEAGPLAKSKYRVITSSSITQDSFRIYADGALNESTTATVLSRSLCEAAGWDLIKSKRISMRADLDKDRTVLFDEAYFYARDRVRKYVQSVGLNRVQDVQVYPLGTPFVLFMRS